MTLPRKVREPAAIPRIAGGALPAWPGPEAMAKQPTIRYCTIHKRHALTKRGMCWHCHDLTEAQRHGGKRGGRRRGAAKARRKVREPHPLRIHARCGNLHARCGNPAHPRKVREPHTLRIHARCGHPINPKGLKPWASTQGVGTPTQGAGTLRLFHARCGNP